jgi:hypothetical protein
MDRKSRFAQSYSAQLVKLMRGYDLSFWEGRAALLYDLRGEALQMPPWPGNLPHASASVS